VVRPSHANVMGPGKLLTLFGFLLF
jgi:hypothetical protein